MNMRFTFIGKIDANGEDSKVPFIRELKSDNGKGLGLNLISIAAENNRAFVECAGFTNKTIKTKNEDNEDIKVDWDDRFDADIVKSVAGYRKNVIKLNGERHEFISTYDFIQFIKEHIDEIKGKRFTVTGRVKKNVYKGKISDRFEIGNLYEITEDDEEKKNKLNVSGEFYFNKESFDFADWSKEKKIYINGYTKEYIDADNQNVFVDKMLIFDASKIDFENEKHVALLSYKLAQIGLSLDESSNINCECKRGKYYKMYVVTTYANGAEEVEFDEKELTANQKLAIELGLKTLDDFKPAGSIYGERKVTYKIVNYDLRGEYADGMVLVKDEDVEENLYVIPENETVEEVEKKATSKKEEAPAPVVDDDEDLFS